MVPAGRETFAPAGFEGTLSDSDVPNRAHLGLMLRLFNIRIHGYELHLLLNFYLFIQKILQRRIQTGNRGGLLIC